jgi:hypothetical protein
VPSQGAVAWVTPEATSPGEDSWDIRAPIAASGDELFVPLAGHRQSGVACLVLRSGGGLPQLKWFTELPGGVGESPAVVQDRVFALSGRAGEGTSQLVCTHRNTGQVLWNHTTTSSEPSHLWADAQGVVLRDTENRLCSLTLDGKVVWTRQLGLRAGAFHCREPFVIATADRPPLLLALDRQTGSPLWQVALPRATISGPVLFQDRIYTAGECAVEMRSVLDGHLVARCPAADHPAGPMYVDASEIAYVDRTGRLLIHDASSLAILREISDCTPGMNVLATDTAMLFVRGENLVRLSRTQLAAPPTIWLDLSQVGSISAPAIVHRRSVYLPVKGKGLTCLVGATSP